MLSLVLSFAPKERTDWGVGVSPTKEVGELSKKKAAFLGKIPFNLPSTTNLPPPDKRPVHKGLRPAM